MHMTDEIMCGKNTYQYTMCVYMLSYRITSIPHETQLSNTFLQ